MVFLFIVKNKQNIFSGFNTKDRKCLVKKLVKTFFKCTFY